MKKIYSKIGSTMLLSAGLTMCLAACTSDDESTNPSKDEKIAWTFEVGNGDVRTMLYPDKDNKVVFKKGDSISVFNNLEAGASTKAGGDKFVAGKAEDFGDGDTASVAMFNGYANIGAQHFAILYPYQADAAASGITAGSATVTAAIPTEQTATPDSFDPKANISVATTEAHAWDVPKFYLKNAVGLLKFSVKAVGSTTSYSKAVIYGAKGEKIAGTTSITVGSGDPTIGEGDATEITLKGNIEAGKTYYVAMLTAGGEQKFEKGIVIKLYNEKNWKVGADTIFNSSTKVGPVVKRSKILNVGAVTPEMPLDFTVGIKDDGTPRKVSFAPGNLYCKKDASGIWTWGFYDEPWKYNFLSMGKNSRTANASDDEIDLFCWGYDATGSTNPVEKTFYPSFTDWGSADAVKASIGDGWRMLNNAEWTYLISSRTDNTTARFAKATVHNVNGLLLIPDGYEKNGSNNTMIDSVMISNVNVTTASFAMIYNDDWTMLKEAGCVFLPCAGNRTGASVNLIGTHGDYWSSVDHDASNAYCLYFGNTYFDPAGYGSRSDARSVRLVHSAG